MHAFLMSYDRLFPVWLVGSTSPKICDSVGLLKAMGGSHLAEISYVSKGSLNGVSMKVKNIPTTQYRIFYMNIW